MAESVQTRPGGPSRLGQAVPMVTELAALDERDVIHGRQIYKDCGFYQWQETTSGRIPLFPFPLLHIRPFACPNAYSR
jgi:hypothetical protein